LQTHHVKKGNIVRHVSGILIGLFLGVFAFTNPARAADDSAPKKWYVGVGGGLGYLSGPDWTAQDNYYNSQGYYATGGYGMGLGGGIQLYGGWRPRDFVDLELGLAAVVSNHSTTYTNATGSSVIWSRRMVSFRAVSASALFRPTDDAAHFLYLKLGLHYSNYGTDIVSINGTAANTGVIAAGDHIPTDAHYRGWGPLLGAGMDFGDRPGFLRVEYVNYLRIGGTSERAGLLNVSYHHNF
jgi:hypothetical protein